MSSHQDPSQLPPGPEPLTLKDLVDSFGDHSKASADLLRRFGKGEKTDLLDEGAQCFGRLVQTGAQFYLFWHNMAKLIATNRDSPRMYPHPPVGSPNSKALLKIPAQGLGNPTAISGLRRRGEDKDSVDASKVTVTPNAAAFVVEVDCAGVARGLYEGSFAADPGQKKVVYNIYIDPV